MNKNIEHYCLVIKGAIDKNICKETINFLKKSKYQKHLFYSNTDGYQKLSKHKELEITYDQAPTYDKLMQAVFDCLTQYVNHVRLEFKIPYLNGWQGYSGIRFNRYKKGQQMHQHVDFIETLFDDKRGVPKLSIVGNLNDDYKGGEFIMYEDKNIEMHTGDVIIFPSTFLYPHKVNEVKKGIRYSFVSWAW
jgi:predicted 2-oxoglutarate/Fe(II)-dependent dioxygenase YbiX|tara:strand:+ start:2998 stop:3570 length:573 start_codon:yes stop_codon:yes gene_type:complete